MNHIQSFENFNYTPNHYDYECKDIYEGDLDNAEEQGYLKAFSSSLYKRLKTALFPTLSEEDTVELKKENYFSYINYNRRDHGLSDMNSWVYSIYLMTDDSFIFIYKDCNNENKCFHCSNYENLIKTVKEKQEDYCC